MKTTISTDRFIRWNVQQHLKISCSKPFVTTLIYPWGHGLATNTWYIQFLSSEPTGWPFHPLEVTDQPVDLPTPTSPKKTHRKVAQKYEKAKVFGWKNHPRIRGIGNPEDEGLEPPKNCWFGLMFFPNSKNWFADVFPFPRRHFRVKLPIVFGNLLS